MGEDDVDLSGVNVLTNDTDLDTSDLLSITGINTTGTLGIVIDNGDDFRMDPRVPLVVPEIKLEQGGTIVGTVIGIADFGHIPGVLNAHGESMPEGRDYCSIPTAS